jgi:hypothetical protein
MSAANLNSEKYFSNSKSKEGVNEDALQQFFINWFKREYPNDRITSTLNGIKMSPGLAAKASRQQSHRGVPDTIIHKSNKHFSSLYLELKKDGTRIYKRDGTLVKNDHIEEQAAYIIYLREQGHCADFAIGYVDAVIKAKTYMDGQKFEYTYK